MNQVLRFLQSLRNLKNSGVIKSVDQAMDFAKNQFGKIDDLFKRQIEEIFKAKPKREIPPGGGGITSIKNAPKKETPSQASGIMSEIEASGQRLEGAANRMAEIQKEIDAMYKPKPDTSPLMKRLEEGVETLRNPQNLTTGLTRTLARELLLKRGIDLGKGMDPIEIVRQKFGGDVLGDLANLADELIEMERMGRTPKRLEDILEQEGFFDIKMSKEPPQGYSDKELEDIKKQIDQEKQLEDFDPEDREPNSMGGLNRTSYKLGSGKSLIKFVKGKKNLLKKIKQAVADIFPTGDPKYDADVAVDTMFEELNVDRDMFDQKELLDAYGMAYDELKKPLLAELKNKPKPFPKTADDVKKEAVEKYGIKPERVDEIMNTQFDEKILDDVDKAYGVTPKMKKELDEMAKLTPKAAERFELKMKYPGIDENLLTSIIEDPDPQRKAEVLATIDQAFELMRRGKSPDEILSIFKKATDRTKQATGGLSYLMGM